MIQEQVGRYEVISELGEGGMATVYLARDPNTKREVAVKVLYKELSLDDDVRARFWREAEIIAALEHDAIVPVYDVGEQDGRLFTVMRYMPGGPLSKRLTLGALSTASSTGFVPGKG